MNNYCILPIVEGHGEVEAIRLLLQRVWVELLGGNYMHVLKPLRIPKSNILKADLLTPYLRLAERKLAQEPGYEGRSILILFDADNDLPCALSNKIMEIINKLGVQFSPFCVIANKEFETWFVASADTMPDEFKCPDINFSETAELNGRGKKWVKENLKEYYSETADMPRLTEKINIELVRKRCPSFDKLCRELTRLRDLS